MPIPVGKGVPLGLDSSDQGKHEPSLPREGYRLQLAEEDKYQFQWWALGQVGARPTDQKKGADRGIDGRLYFHDDESGQSKQIIFSVKGGHITASQVRDLAAFSPAKKQRLAFFSASRNRQSP